MRTIKKYANRRLYDTTKSEYITLDELAETVREGIDVKVVDAKTDQDLTQATLAQIVVETGAARLLPATLLHQMIRMGDDALAEFMQLYVAWALDVYFEVKKGVGKIPALGNLANFDEGSPLAKLLSLNPIYRTAKSKLGSNAKSEPEPKQAENGEDVANLRAEIDELKDLVRNLATQKN